MSNYEDDQSEDGELAHSPIQEEMDFSLSDDDKDNADSLVIKPPQAVIRPSHRDKRGHKRTGKDRYKEMRKEKKHPFRERDKAEKPKREINQTKNPEREEIAKEYYREKAYYRDKEMYREKESYREKEMYREKEVYREKEMYRDNKELYREKDLREKEAYRDGKEMYREKEIREKEMYREGKEVYREKDIREKDTYREREKDVYKDKELYREKDPYRERDYHREREMYRDNTTFREPTRSRDVYRDKEMYKDKEGFKEKEPQRDMYLNRERQYKYTETERKHSDHSDTERIESRLRQLAEESRANPNNEKENRDKSSGDKELEDLRTRLLNKRISKELQKQDKRSSEYSDKESKSSRQSSLDKHQENRKNKMLFADKEREKRKYESRTELEARRQQLRRRVKRRAVSPGETTTKKNRTNGSPSFGDSVVTLSDSSDAEMKSASPHSEPEEGEHTNTESEEGSSGTESESAVDSKSEEDDHNTDKSDKEEKQNEPLNDKTREHSKSKSPSPRLKPDTPSSHESRRSISRSKSRSRSHSFSPPPPGENGKAIEEEKPTEDDEQARQREEAISALPPYFPALQGCRSVEEFQCLNRIEEGTYGVVYRARDKTTEEIVALKRLKMEKEKEGFPITSLREINTLLKGQHPNIVTVREIVVGSNMDKIFIVMDYVEHDLKSLMETMRGKKQVFLPGEVKCLMTQLLKAVHHLHDNWILHRDLKTSNLLLSHKGVLKVGDFGLAREYGSPLRQYTPIVVTLWYRAPELLLCGKLYSTHIDMWSVGCIFAEFVTMNPLFPGKSEVDQLNRIFKDLGTPSESVWPGYSELPAVQKMTFAEHPAGGLRQRVGAELLSEPGLALLQALLTYNPAKRSSADAALEHAYFKEHPVAIDPAMFPTWPAKSEGNRRSTHSPRPPAGGAAYAQYARADSDEALGFQVHRSLNVAPGFSLKF